VLILLTAGVLIIVEVPGGLEGVSIAEGYSPSGGGVVYGEYFLHGWPWIYLNRYEGSSDADTCSDEMKAPWLMRRAWNLCSNSQSRVFSFFDLILDILIGFIILLVIAFCFEWRRRLRNRLFQFTLREILSLMLITAAVLSWWRIHHNHRVHELEIANHFDKDMYWSEKYRGPEILARIFGTGLLTDFEKVTDCNGHDYFDKRRAEEWFCCLKEFDNLERITIGYDFYKEKDNCVSDKTISHLSTLSNLQSLDIAYAQITDSGMETIAHFAKLKSLNLHDTAITSHGVRYLESTPLLEKLILSNTKIDDAAAETLGRLEYLTELCLAGTKLTDKSIPHIQQLSNLESLNISDTKISDKSYQELKSRLPNCSISY
jgi:hypothetical protein